MSENNKKWYENIPEQGVLIKDELHDVVLRLLPKTANKLNSESDYLFVRPLTPVEWWQFAPFQDMKTAPENTELLLLDNDGFIVPIDRISKGRAECHGDELPLSNFKGWLPLPEESQ